MPVRLSFRVLSAFETQGTRASGWGPHFQVHSCGRVPNPGWGATLVGKIGGFAMFALLLLVACGKSEEGYVRDNGHAPKTTGRLSNQRRY